MTPSDVFRRMADDIDRNDPKAFGGAYLFVPPDQGGPTDGGLLVKVNSDPNQAAVQFWIAVQAHLKALMERMQDQERVAQGFGRGR